MKRFNCTVGDKRGYKGDCMELSATGRYVEFSTASASRNGEIKQLSKKLLAASRRLEWLESMHTLHGVIEILYVVDGYQLMLTYDDSQIGTPVHGVTLTEAIDNAIAAGWKPLRRGGTP